ncbi:MAG: hypothetical protein EXR77_05145 [Myxococcales bacterium]|nr:hypothetical protein [Myxococcales bacterium]
MAIPTPSSTGWWPMLRLGSALAVLAALTACTPKYAMPAPDGFVRFEDKKGLAYITADGVQVRSRSVRNYPKADLAFWADAMERHLVARGYLLHAKKCFKTSRGADGCTAEFVLPHSGEDWVLAETLFVHGDHIAVVETAGPFDRYKKVAASVAKAMESFEVLP